MHQVGDPCRRYVARAKRCKGADVRISRRAGDFGDGHPTFIDGDKIRERTADLDTNPH
jgi:hypothetical protein